MYDFDFSGVVEKASKQRFSKCIQCGKCTSGCPVADNMEFPPSTMIRMLQLGIKDELLASNSAWICTSCYTCSLRCPMNIEVATVIDSIRKFAVIENTLKKDREIMNFHKIFLNIVKIDGRVYELGLIMLFKAVAFQPFKDMLAGVKMFFKGKLKLFPEIVKR